MIFERFAEADLDMFAKLPSFWAYHENLKKHAKTQYYKSMCLQGSLILRYAEILQISVSCDRKSCAVRG